MSCCLTSLDLNYRSINMQYLHIGEKERILIVAPHPDDECIGAGGIIVRYAPQCDVIVLTDGRIGQGDIDALETKQIRKNEFIKEMQLAKVKSYQMLDIEDGTLVQHTDCLNGMDLSNYTKIFVTGTHDNHQDHTAAFLAVMSRIKKQNLSNTEVFVYEVHAALQNPTHLLDITDEINEKLRFIRCHQSQLSQLPYDRLAQVNAEYRALQNRLPDRLIEVYYQANVKDDYDPILFELEIKLQKQIQFYQVLVKWLEKRNKNCYIKDFLLSQSYKEVAIYGYAELGKLLYQELSESPIKVLYIIDKKDIKVSNGENLMFYMPQKNLRRVDVVIVTAIYYYEEIKKELKELGFKNVISLNDILTAL